MPFHAVASRGVIYAVQKFTLFQFIIISIFDLLFYHSFLLFYFLFIIFPYFFSIFFILVFSPGNLNEDMEMAAGRLLSEMEEEMMNKQQISSTSGSQDSNANSSVNYSSTNNNANSGGNSSGNSGANSVNNDEKKSKLARIEAKMFIEDEVSKRSN